MKFIPYLVFQGKAEEAMKFYEAALGGKITGIQRFGDMPADAPQDAFKNYVLHGELVAGDLKIYFSDSPNNVAQGENVTILVDCASEQEVDRLYAALSIDAEIHMTLQKTFWKAKYANLKDKFGVSWQLNYQFA
ncbi:MAG: VOC family protein [Spirochaetales bacterium]|jgi:PhnB protein